MLLQFFICQIDAELLKAAKCECIRTQSTCYKLINFTDHSSSEVRNSGKRRTLYKNQILQAKEEKKMNQNFKFQRIKVLQISYVKGHNVMI